VRVERSALLRNTQTEARRHTSPDEHRVQNETLSKARRLERQDVVRNRDKSFEPRIVRR
jgi:hypothetical protein